MSFKPPTDHFVVDKFNVMGMSIAGIICTTILIFVIIHFLYKSREKKIEKLMKTFAVWHICGGLMFCIAAGFYRTDFVFAFIKYNISDTMHPNLKICKLTVYIPFISYYFSKMFLYLFFIQKIDSPFKMTAHECNAKFVYLFRTFAILSCVILVTLFILFAEFQYGYTFDQKYHICSYYTFSIPHNIGGVAIVLLSVFDLMFSTLTLSIFAYKLRKLGAETTKYHSMQYQMKSNMEIDMPQNKHEYVYTLEGGRRRNNLIHLALKGCVLSSVAIASNWLFLFVGLAFIFDLGAFICIDAMVNGVCVYLMFAFNSRLYNCICCPCHSCWKWLAKCLGVTIQKKKQNLYKFKYKKQIVEMEQNKDNSNKLTDTLLN